jgi:hypothetical protein
MIRNDISGSMQKTLQASSCLITYLCHYYVPVTGITALVHISGARWKAAVGFAPWNPFALRHSLCQLDGRLCEPLGRSERCKEQIVIWPCHANTCRECLKQIVSCQLTSVAFTRLSDSCLGWLPLLAYAIYCVGWVLNASVALIVSSCHLSIYTRDGDISPQNCGRTFEQILCYVLLQIRTALDHHRGEYLNCWLTLRLKRWLTRTRLHEVTTLKI